MPTLALSYLDQDDSLFDCSTSRIYLVGLCTGMLPAAAMAASSSTSHLLKLAPQIVLISLRLGVEAHRRSAQIEVSTDSWAFVVPGMAPQQQQECLDQFHSDFV